MSLPPVPALTSERAPSLAELLPAALAARPLPTPDERRALRLLSGFYEGYPALSIDLYGRSLLLHDHHDPEGDEATARVALDLVREHLPWIQSCVWKVRKSKNPERRSGQLLLGTPAELDAEIVEDGVRYALDLRLNHDASFYLDTRPLRAWLRTHLAGLTALNAFAYTGSLGVAALAGGARRVVQLDRNPAFLDLARRSCALNRLPLRRGDLIAADFFQHAGRLRHQDALFDAVIVDPPFFAQTSGGRVDLAADAHRVLNKVRPLIGDGGWLVAVNNALFLPGSAFQAVLDQLCAPGYLTIEALLPIPDDVTGYPATRRGTPPSDPAPFNHPTKIAILRARRKDGRRATASQS